MKDLDVKMETVLHCGLRVSTAFSRFMGALALACVVSHAKEFSADFAVVMIDDATEKKLGAFPYDRAEIAKAVEACAKLHAKAVVLKFFFDQPRSAAGDAALAAAMKKIPVILQARLEAREGTTTDLPARFRYANNRLPSAMSGDRGWIPIPAFLDAAADLGFVDFDGPEIPLIEEYRGAPYKSLVLCCLEQAAGERASVTLSGRIALGPRSLAVDRRNVFHGTLAPLENLKTISFVDLVQGEAAANTLAGRVVIIGWDSQHTPTLPTPIGPIKIHRLFTQCLATAWRALEPASPATPPAPP